MFYELHDVFFFLHFIVEICVKILQWNIVVYLKNIVKFANSNLIFSKLNVLMKIILFGTELDISNIELNTNLIKT